MSKIGRPRTKPALIEQAATRAARQAADREERERRAREREIVALAARYEAVRFEPGRDRDSAYNALALALHRHGAPVLCGDRWWSWSIAMDALRSDPDRRT